MVIFLKLNKMLNKVQQFSTLSWILMDIFWMCDNFIISIISSIISFILHLIEFYLSKREDRIGVILSSMWLIMNTFWMLSDNLQLTILLDISKSFIFPLLLGSLFLLFFKNVQFLKRFKF